MYLYSHWQRCSHVYGAVGVSFLRRTVQFTTDIIINCIGCFEVWSF